MVRGHDVTLVAGFLKEKKSFGLSDHLHYLPSIKKSGLGYPSFALSLFFYLCKSLFHDKPDLVLVHPFSFFSVLPYVLLARLGAIRSRFVLDIRTVPVEFKGMSAWINDRLFHIAVKGASRLFHGFTVITPFMKQFMEERYGLQGCAVGIWSSGVATEHFDPDRTDKVMTGKMRKAWKLSGKFVVMYHGVLTANRGLFEAVEAMKIVSKETQDIVLLLIGKGAAKKALMENANRLGLNGQVQLRGPVDHSVMPGYVGLSDVGLLPFPSLMWWRVSSPIKLMEYLAMRKTVIVTDIEAHRDVLDERGIAIYVSNNHPKILAEGILTAYRHRSGVKDKGFLARQLAESRFTWKIQAENLARYLEETVML